MLGPTEVVSLRARAEMRRGARIHAIRKRRIPWIYALAAILVILLDQAANRYDLPIHAGYEEVVSEWHKDPTTPSPWAFSVSAVLAVLMLWSGWAHIRPHQIPLGPPFSRRLRGRVAFRCGVVLLICARVQTASSAAERQVFLRGVDVSVSWLVRALFEIPHDRSIVAFQSHRKKALRQHVELVSAALQKVTLKLDSDPDIAVREIASLVLRVCESHAQRRVGALLDESYLTGLEPVQSREWIRLSVTVTATVLIVLGVSFLDPPAAVQPLIIGMVGLMAFTAAYGPRAPQALTLLDSLRGVQRP
ncbi:hypothetical protein ABZ547_42835 [Streptomyces sparsogenes]|uniref:hypothetical protein n=1 Tax=Streptomyces sparsogenes TaxID=67365 RepID=UPI0033C9895A